MQDKYKGNINNCNKDGLSLGHVAIQRGDLDSLKYYFSRNLKQDIRTKSLGESLFHYSIVYSDNQIIWSYLLENGYDINSPDKNGETPLIKISHLNFTTEKFQFLLSHGCDINKKSKENMCPLSSYIKNNLDNEAQILLDQKANILDPKSKNEPIVVALREKNEKWFKILINHGASTRNTSFSVIEHYIHMPFFDLEFLKTIKDIDIKIGYPIHRALQDKKHDCVKYLWDTSTPEERQYLAKHKDHTYRRCLLSWALKCSDDYLISEVDPLTEDKYAPDSLNRTPLIYACIENNQKWIERYVDLYTNEQLDHNDCDGCNAMYYAAQNQDSESCNKFFIKNCDPGCGQEDQYGILKYYRDLLGRYNNARDVCEQYYNTATTELNQLFQRHQVQTNLGNEFVVQFNNEYNWDKREKIKKEIDKCAEKLNELNEQIDYFREYQAKCAGIYLVITNSTREDILAHINDMEEQVEWMKSAKRPLNV